MVNFESSLGNAHAELLSISGYIGLELVCAVGTGELELSTIVVSSRF